MPLTVYKASAGSGKTFRLAVEFISLLVSNPENYRNILAVTFTNKATAEMKLRILSQLYGIAHALPSSDGYLKEVHTNTQLPADVIRQRALTALSLLTHHYSDFRVQTIDAFFQTVLRNLARELDLTSNLRVAINSDDINNEAVDEMIAELKPGSKVLRWIGEYIQSKMDENLSWNVIGSIKEFGKNIFREFYQSHREQLNERLSADGFFEQFQQSVRTLRDASLKALVKPYEDMLALIQQEGLDKSLFSGTSNEYTYIEKMIALDFPKNDIFKYLTGETGKTRQKRIEDPNAWIAQKNKKNPEAQRIVDLASSHLCAMMARAEENRRKQANLYFSAKMTLVHLNQLRLLRAIEKAVDAGNQDANRFLLCNTQHLLHTMIDGSDTPFIFEKIGAQLRHIMIDEFQDTSTVQWQNFKVLLDNCLAQPDSRSLIVGDVKQSIYRWRSGDWTLLNNMHDDALTTIKQMTANYRSSAAIIHFNNAFFRVAAELERAKLLADGITAAEQLTHAYADVEQEAKKQTPGRVEVQLISRGKDMTAADVKAAELSVLSDYICQLLEQGVPVSSIAILVRDNKQIANIADFFVHDEQLQKQQVRVVSDEAFLLETSISLRIIITALHYITHSDERLAEAELAKQYQVYVLQRQLTDAEILMGDRAKAHLPEGFVAELPSLSTMPILDLVDHLYDLFQLHRISGQTAYVCAFRDLLAEYLDDHAADIDEVVKYWEDTLREKKIQIDDVEGIRILTIHKSKGLEYDHVIMPFCDWEMEKLTGKVTLWCDKPHPTPFSDLPLLPIDYSKRMLHTVFADDYREEHFQNTVDNLNLLYVAFTRACSSLFILGERDKKGGDNARSYLLENALKELAKNALPGAELWESEDGLTFCYEETGQSELSDQSDLSDSSDKSKKPPVNVFEQSPTPQTITVETFQQQASFRQSNRSRDFVSTDEPTPRNRYIARGSLLHEIFSTIHTLDDVEPTLARLTLDGIIADGDEELADVRRQISQCLEQREARDWFSPRWTLYNECTILTSDPQTGHTLEQRPDRVMSDGEQTIVVDFKFGQPRAEYHEQVKGYVALLEEMGMPAVKGYLWYVTGQKVEPVS